MIRRDGIQRLRDALAKRPALPDGLSPGVALIIKTHEDMLRVLLDEYDTLRDERDKLQADNAWVCEADVVVKAARRIAELDFDDVTDEEAQALADLESALGVMPPEVIPS